MAIEFDTDLIVDGVNTAINVVGQIETRFGFIVAIHLDAGPTIQCPATTKAGNLGLLGMLLEDHLAVAYRDEIAAEANQQARDIANTHPHRAARNRVYADLMGIPAL